MSKTISQLRLDPKLPKGDLFRLLASQMSALGFKIEEIDHNRPWGGFVRITNNQAKKFIEAYFSGVQLPKGITDFDLSPKILVVEQKQRLSYQVHERRSEVWRVLDGPVGAKLNSTDDETQDHTIYHNTEIIEIPVGTRHRLIGLEKIGIVAELWIHIDPKNPSDEKDIRRIQDDFARMTGK